MRAVNLIPAEQRRGAGGIAGRSGGIAYVIAGGLAVLVVLGAIYALAVHKVADEKGTLADVTNQVTATTAQAGTLAPYVSFQSFAQNKVSATVQLAETRFDWPDAMAQLALGLPSDVTLTAFSGTAATGASAGGAATPGSFDLTGCASSQAEVAQVLIRLAQVPGVTNVSLSSTTEAKRLQKGLSGGREAAAVEAASGGCPYLTFQLSVAYSGSYTIPNSKTPAGAQTASTGSTASTSVATAASQGSTGVNP